MNPLGLALLATSILIDNQSSKMSGGHTFNNMTEAAAEEFDDIGGFLDSISSRVSSAEVSSRYDLDDELRLKEPARIIEENREPQAGGSKESVAGTEKVAADSVKARKPGLLARVIDDDHACDEGVGMVEKCAATVLVAGTPLHARLEKKVESLYAAVQKLKSADPEFKKLCKEFGENFEKTHGPSLKQTMYTFMLVLQNAYEFTDQQVGMTMLLEATRQASKSGDAALVNGMMTLRVLGGYLSFEDDQSAQALCRLTDGDLVGDSVGGSQVGLTRFAQAGEPSSVYPDAHNDFVVAWIEFMTQLAEYDSSMAVELARWVMEPGRRHALWQGVSAEGYLENIMLWSARAMAARKRLVRYEAIVGVLLSPQDPFGLMKHLWPAIFPEFRECILESVTMLVAMGRNVVLLDKIPVLKSWEAYEALLKYSWKMWNSKGSRKVRSIPKLKPPGTGGSGQPRNPGGGGAGGAGIKKADKVCFHWKKFGCCKNKEPCHNGSHPPNMATPQGFVPPAPGPPSVLVGGGGSGSAGAVVQEKCRRCEETFSEDPKDWIKCDMPKHCSACRVKNRLERKAAQLSSSLVAAAGESVEGVETEDAWDEVIQDPVAGGLVVAVPKGYEAALEEVEPVSECVFREMVTQEFEVEMVEMQRSAVAVMTVSLRAGALGGHLDLVDHMLAVVGAVPAMMVCRKGMHPRLVQLVVNSVRSSCSSGVLEEVRCCMEDAVAAATMALEFDAGGARQHMEGDSVPGGGDVTGDGGSGARFGSGSGNGSAVGLYVSTEPVGSPVSTAVFGSAELNAMTSDAIGLVRQCWSAVDGHYSMVAGSGLLEATECAVVRAVERVVVAGFFLDEWRAGSVSPRDLCALLDGIGQEVVDSCPRVRRSRSSVGLVDDVQSVLEHSIMQLFSRVGRKAGLSVLEGLQEEEEACVSSDDEPICVRARAGGRRAEQVEDHGGGAELTQCNSVDSEVEFFDRQVRRSGGGRHVTLFVRDKWDRLLVCDQGIQREEWRSFPGMELGEATVSQLAAAEVASTFLSIEAAPERFRFMGYTQELRGVCYFFELRVMGKVEPEFRGGGVGWLTREELTGAADIVDSMVFWRAEEKAAFAGFERDVVSSDEFEYAVHEYVMGSQEQEQDEDYEQAVADCEVGVGSVEAVLGSVSECESTADVNGDLVGLAAVVPLVMCQMGDDELECCLGDPLDWRVHGARVNAVLKSACKATGNGLAFTQRNIKDAAKVVKEALCRLGEGKEEQQVAAEVEAEYEIVWGACFTKVVVDAVGQLAVEVTERQERKAVVRWGEQLSLLTQVCSGWRADVLCLASGGQCPLSAKARRVGERRQLKITSMFGKGARVVISRADYVGSWPAVKARSGLSEVVKGDTALEQAERAALQAATAEEAEKCGRVGLDFGGGSVEPHQ